jgi:ABC-type polysaccharide/polyol phosphate transport system ATPase subunit
VIAAEQLGIRFLFDRDRRLVMPTMARIRRHGTESWGLRDLSFSISSGEGVALLGPSGSGKTTLLRTMAQVMFPDEGRMTVRGRVASLLSTDSGLMPPLTGRENALLLGVLAGLSRAASRVALPRVRERTGLGAAFDRPVSSYSQGMRARLGFAVADELDPQVLLLDEVHEAFDHEFRTILERRAHEVLAAGGVVVAAGHDHEMLRRLCTRGLWLEEGRLRGYGDFATTQAAYLEAHS